MKLFKKKEKIIPKLSDEEKAFILAWAGLYNTPLTCKVCRGSDDVVRFGDRGYNGWFLLRRKYDKLKVGEEYTIEELTK